MANTIIHIKKSTVTAAPPTDSLEAGELAYSYVSNTAYIGNSDGSGVLPIGGYAETLKLAAAFSQANGANIIPVGNTMSNGYFSIRSSKRQINFVEGTNVTITVDDDASLNVANVTINASAGSDPIAGLAYAKANLAYTYAANDAMLVANSAYDKANAANITADSTYTFAANTVRLIANTAYDKANAANVLADAALPKTGGTITGDLIISGNLTTSGEITYSNTNTLMVGDNIFVLNSDLPQASAPSEDAGMEINRGSSTNVSILWYEAGDVWQFTNDGSTFYNIPTNTAVESATTIGSAAYDKANSANLNAANASFLTTGTVASARISGSYTGITGVGTIAAGTWNGDLITVPYGGTGNTTHTNNGILFGNTTGAIRATAAGTEGQVLLIDTTGVPILQHLDGGSF